MILCFKRIFLFAIILSFMVLPSLPAKALSIGGIDPVSVLNRAANTIVSRVSDIIYYLIMQKEYIFNDFKDPNNYPTLTIPPVVEEISSSTNISVVPANTGAIMPANTTTLPITDKTVVSVTKKGISQTATNVPALKFESSVVNSVPVKKENVIIDNNSEILIYTNKERKAESLTPLVSNSYLDKIAGLRADDLFANQYFEHESPDGQSASELAEELGYSYLLIGENLALGDFADDRSIVSAWMDSPGHRANILNEKYTELGVAVKNGIYNGQDTLIAVQIFGLPLSHCPRPSLSSKELIDTASASIKKMQAEAAQMYDNLNAMKNSTGLDKAYYVQKISEYNYFAKKVNDAVFAYKGIVDAYNIEVARYNQCIK